ncbi:hypothetical protein IWX90DRAFT_496069 [Phyllosticta citrichinensis]|uniref:Uncharacterized protein n=1 Tax=Phyllosticta citrichinensis TaxID=1130410 RepID=A0ABR1XF49_9PEZI
MDLWNPQAPLLERVRKQPNLKIENPEAAIVASGLTGTQGKTKIVSCPDLTELTVPDTLILGSDAHLLDVIQDFETLRNQYILDFGKPTSSELELTVDKLIAECRRLLESSSLIKDDNTRRRFFATVKKLATDIIHLTSVKEKVHDTVERIREGERVNKARTGFIKDLPRWNQFLDKNAPGASILLLQTRRLLHQKRDAYQVIPRGGVKILQFWDERLWALIQAIDSLRPQAVSLWHKRTQPKAQARPQKGKRANEQTQRIEWGHPSMHRLNFGLRTFEPMTFEPSPWNKLDHATHTFRDVSRFDRRLGALMPRVSGREGAFAPPDHDDAGDDDAFDAVLTQRFVKRENKEAERQRKLDKERRRKMQVIQGAGPQQQQGESSASAAASSSS